MNDNYNKFNMNNYKFWIKKKMPFFHSLFPIYLSFGAATQEADNSLFIVSH